MNLLDRVIAQFSPARAVNRVRARKALGLLTANYDAATSTRRSGSVFAAASDADGAAWKRRRIAFISRDMIRNTPYAGRAQQVIANNVVGSGCIPKIGGGSDRLKRRGLQLIQQHLDTAAIDADGRTNLYGLQRTIINTLVDSGEVLVRRRNRVPRADGLALPFQLQVMEPDFIDDAWDGLTADGNQIFEGIEFDRRGRRVAYYLFDEHPGSKFFRGYGGLRTGSRRIPASEVLHIYRSERPGQKRGVSWFASVALHLQDLGDHQDALIMQQKIAACFAAFRSNADLEDEDALNNPLTELQPGAIYDLAANEQVTFAEPKGIGGGKEVDAIIMRAIASGVGITYEALSGDLSGVNFSSGRMGRVEMDRNVASWQEHILLPQFLQPLTVWFKDAWLQIDGNPAIPGLDMAWTFPRRVVVDPGKEVIAEVAKVKAGFASRQSVIRSMGEDPETVDAEILADLDFAQEHEILFSSSPDPLAMPPVAEALPDGQASDQEDGADEGQPAGQGGARDE